MADRFMGISTIYGADGQHETPYLTRMWIGRLRLHIFHRGDADPDCHDHPWDFWTFPLTAYAEEVAVPHGNGGWERQVDFVPAFRLTFRPAEHTHRVIGPINWGLPWPFPSRIVTIVWRGSSRRKWGFLKNRGGKWCRVGWRDYVFGGGKQAPCETEERD
jgi:hypothetical protein